RCALRNATRGRAPRRSVPDLAVSPAPPARPPLRRLGHLREARGLRPGGGLPPASDLRGPGPDPAPAAARAVGRSPGRGGHLLAPLRGPELPPRVRTLGRPAGALLAGSAAAGARTPLLPRAPPAGGPHVDARGRHRARNRSARQPDGRSGPRAFGGRASAGRRGRVN